MKYKKLNILYCFLASFALITICSKSSFIYPMNDWGDVNCYFILGKGMLHGLVPYRDFIEQKGLVIYALYSIAALISDTSFIGVYFIEILSMALFLYISLKIVGLFFDADKYALPIVFWMAGSVAVSSAFCHGGSPEELMLSLFAYGIYLGIKYFEKNELPGKGGMFVFGLAAGLIFFTKYTLCIIYISVIVFMIFKAVKNKQTGQLFGQSLFFVLGCVTVTIPVVVYLLCNNALGDFAYDYFYENIFNYTPDKTDPGLLSNLKLYGFRFLRLFKKKNMLFLIPAAIGEIWFIVRKKHFIATFLFFTFASFYYLVFVAMRPMRYYGLPLAVLGIFGLCAFFAFLSERNISLNAVLKVCVPVCMIVLAVFFTDNRYFMFKSKDLVPQYIFAKEMDSYGYSDYHMLYYGNLDRGYYFASGTLPNCKAFVQLNLLGDELTKIQNAHISERKCEFIVTESVLCDSKEYEYYRSKYGDTEDVVSFDDFGYELIDERGNYFEFMNYKVRLYKLKD